MSDDCEHVYGPLVWHGMNDDELAQLCIGYRQCGLCGHRKTDAPGIRFPHTAPRANVPLDKLLENDLTE